MIKRPEHKVYQFGVFQVDVASCMLKRDGREVPLPPRAVETLLALIESDGEIVSKNELMSKIWHDSIVDDSNLAQYLHQLRKELGDTTDGKPFIETLRRRGYRFNGNASVVGTAILEDSFQISPASISTQHYVLATAIFGAVLVAASTIYILFAVRSQPVSRGDVTILSLTSGEDVNFATISPDGRHFVYSGKEDGKSHLWIQETGQTGRREITAPISGDIFETAFSPDSEFVYFNAREDALGIPVLYQVRVLGGNRSKILTEIHSAVSFSPDGREMVFLRHHEETNRFSIIIASIDGSRERTLLTESGDETLNNAAWSPDGHNIAFGEISRTSLAGGCTIKTVDPQSAEVKLLSPERWDNCFRMVWTPDAQGLVMVGTKYNDAYSTRRDQIYYLSIADGEARRLTTDNSRYQYASLGITNTDEILAVPFNRLSQIWSMDANGDSRTARQITTGFADGRSGIVPLSDGRVAYQTRVGDGFGILVTNVDGLKQEQLAGTPSEIEEIRAPSSGGFFVFSARQAGSGHLSRVDSDGTRLKELTFGQSLEVDSTVSPDEKWIVYYSEPLPGNPQKPGLWKIPAVGGDSVRLMDQECRTPHFSPDGQAISCISKEKGTILTISAETGAVLASIKAAEKAVLNVGARWTPDGAALTYIVSEKNVGNIWLQVADGSPPKPLTDFTGGDIYNFAFSTDGQRLFVARGYGTRNAVLIRNYR